MEIFIILMVLGVVTVVGHLLWVVAARVLRVLMGWDRPARPPARTAEECLRCERTLPPWRESCPACGLDRASVLARELGDLAATRRQLQRFVNNGTIQRDDFDGLVCKLEEQRDRLLQRRPAAALARGVPASTDIQTAASSAPMAEIDDIPAVIPLVEVVDVPAWRQLETLLLGSRDIHELPTADRARALTWYRQASSEQLTSMSLPAQRLLIGLLRLADLPGEVVTGYRRLLANEVDPAHYAVAALAAGRYAIEHEEREQARWFLQQAVSRSASPNLRRQAEELLLTLQPAPRVEQPAPSLALGASLPVESSAPTVAPIAPPPPPAPPRKSLVEVLSAFMEQGNILWGELVGGLLIVGCSIALVISLWPKLEENPVYRFSIFVSVTVMLFGIGLYTLSHWKLEATSRFLLIIASLLVPLNFLAIAAQTRGLGGPIEVLLELGALAVFAALLYVTAKVLVPQGRVWFTFAVAGASAAQLLVPYLVGPKQIDNWLLLVVLGAVPLACHVIGSCGVIAGDLRQEKLLPERVHALFTHLGISTFCIGVALGLVIAWNVRQGGSVHETLALLATNVSLAAVPLLAGGLLIQRRLFVEPAEALAIDGEPTGESAEPTTLARASDARRRGPLAAAGTATALIGAFVMLLALALAWPLPIPVLLVSVLDFAVLTFVAFRYALPIAHAAAIPCAAVGYLAAFHLFRSHPATLTEYFALPQSGVALVMLAAMVGKAAYWLHDRRRLRDAAYYILGAAGIALASMALVTLPRRGLDEPITALVVYAIYGLGTLILNVRWRHPLASSIGLALLIASSLWGLWWADLEQPAQRVPLWSAVLAGEALLFGMLAWLSDLRVPLFRAELFRETYRDPLARTAEGIAPLAILAVLWSGLRAMAWQPEYILTGACLGFLFLILGIGERRQVHVRISGVLLMATFSALAGFIARMASLPVPSHLALLALAIALAGGFLVAVALWARGRMTGEPASIIVEPSPLSRSSASEAIPWHRVLLAWRETAAGGVVLALLLTLLSFRFGVAAQPTYTFALLAATTFVLAWLYDRAALSWCASFLALASVTHRLALHAEFPTPWPQLALLAHATLALVIGMLVQWLTSRALTVSERSARLQRLFAVPLNLSALTTSAGALTVLLHTGWGTMPSAAMCLFWLATLWLALAWLQRWPMLFSAFQGVLTLAVVLATSAWLEGRDWFMQHPLPVHEAVWDPWSFQAYGIAQGLLGLVWMAARLGLRRVEVGRLMFEPGWLTVDRFALTGLITAQAFLAAYCVLPEVLQELGGVAPVGTEMRLHAFAGGAWAVLGLLAAVLIGSLLEGRTRNAVVGLLVLAGTVPVLVAGSQATDLAAPVALRWGLGLCFVVCSIPIWRCDLLVTLAGRCHVPVSDVQRLPAISRALLVAGTVVPVLIMTLALVLTRVAGEMLTTPAADTLFARLGVALSTLLPLVLIALGLIGHAWRERSAGYTFAAGLVINAAVLSTHTLGYLTLQPDESLWIRLTVQLLQLGALTAGLWALAWMAARAWLYVRGEDVPRRQPLLSFQVGLGMFGNVVLLVAALVTLVELVPPSVSIWTTEAGSLIGWLALLTPAAAHLLYRGWPLAEEQPTLADAGVLGLAVLALLGCSIHGWSPEWGYRSLMLLWAASPIMWVLAAWRASVRQARTDGEYLSADWLEATSRWVLVGGVLTLLLALKSAFVHDQQLSAALAIALACPAGAIVAVWRRREDWAFVAGLGVNLAASFVVWHYHPSPLPFDIWWIALLQANVVAASAVALLWLAVRQRLYGEVEIKLNAGPLLAMQIVLAVLVNAILLVTPLLHIVLFPGVRLPAELLPVGELWGWVALLLTFAAAGWYAIQVARQHPAHSVAGLLLGIGVLTAAGVARFDTAGQWHAFHILTAYWTSAGLLALLGYRYSWMWEIESLASKRTMRLWIVTIGGLVLLLSVRGTWEDPARPYGSAASTFAVLLMATTLAIWSLQRFYINITGLLVNLFGFIIWTAWRSGPEQTILIRPFVATTESLYLTLAICSALAAILWSNVPRLPIVDLQGEPGKTLRDLAERFIHDICWFSLVLLACVGGASIGAALEGSRTVGNEWLAWTALATSILAIADPFVNLRRGSYAVALYGVGLVAVTFILDSAHLSAHDYLWTAALLMALFVLVMALVYWIGSGHGWKALETQVNSLYFFPAQLAVSAAVSVLTVWISLDPSLGLWSRLAGPLAASIILLAIVVMGSQSIDGKRDESIITRLLMGVALVLGALLTAEFGWAAIDPAGHSLSWLVLHRTVWLMVSLALVTALYGPILSSRLPESSGWRESCRRGGPWFGVTAGVVLLAVLAQEAWLYQGTAAGSLMALPAILTVAVAMIAMIAAALYFAVMPGADPFPLTLPSPPGGRGSGEGEKGRTAYVYAAEVLLALMFVHFRLTMPEMFRSGFAARFWPFIVMAIAFAGAGLSEFFSRRQVRVLAEPLERTGLFLPLLPVLGFWFVPGDHYLASNYALVWFMVGALFGFLAISRRSVRYGLLAALAGNFGWWALLYDGNLHFLRHPQLWLIPVAIIVLASERLNHRRLNAQQSALLRYLALSVIYVSSTSEMFINTWGHFWIAPLVLAFLSVLGILAGMLLRIKAFLVLGFAFLLVVVFTIIYHAGYDQGQTWIVWSAGIALGAAMIALFGVFEKRRNDVLRLMEDLRRWE